MFDYQSDRHCAKTQPAGGLCRELHYGTYQVEAAALVDTTFALQDASTAQTLIADRDAYLPKLKVDERRDRAWNR